MQLRECLADWRQVDPARSDVARDLLADRPVSLDRQACDLTLPKFPVRLAGPSGNFRPDLIPVDGQVRIGRHALASPLLKKSPGRAAGNRTFDRPAFG